MYSKMKWTATIAWLGSVLFFWAGCCSPCDQSSLGDFQLQEDSLDWLAFADGAPRRYRSNDGQEKLITYNFLQQVVVDRQENCREINCGLCCDNFTAESATTTLVSDDNSLIFTLRIEKNFLTNDVNEVSGEVDDLLFVSLNGQINCELSNLPENRPDRTIELSNRTFTDVLVCEIEPDAARPETGRVFRYYFRPGLGIVGFEEASGRIWALQ